MQDYFLSPYWDLPKVEYNLGFAPLFAHGSLLVVNGSYKLTGHWPEAGRREDLGHALISSDFDVVA